MKENKEIYSTIISLADTDAAGMVFYGTYFRLAQQALEAFFENQGMPLRTLIEKENVLLPIVESNAKYHKPLRLSTPIRIEVNYRFVGEKRVEFSYFFLNEDGNVTTEITTTHAIQGGSLRELLNS